MPEIDLRSDTVTRPTKEMRRKIAAAEVGDDVYGEDPTVRELERRVADRLGHDAAVLVTSGTQGNLVSVLAHCGRGDAYLVGRDYHSYDHEGGGAAALGGIHPAALETEADGRLPPETVRDALAPSPGPPGPRSALLGLQTPVGGSALSVDELAAPARIAADEGLAVHLDGARLFNVAAARETSAAELAGPADSVMISLVKGLGAPVGAVVSGSEPFIDEARYWRKMVGGGCRQAGILAAAGLHALDHHVDRLPEDHRRARRLAEGLAECDGLRVDRDRLDTNMVFAELLDADPPALASSLREAGVRVHPSNPLRLVTHLDISDEDVDRAVEALRTRL